MGIILGYREKGGDGNTYKFESTAFFPLVSNLLEETICDDRKKFDLRVEGVNVEIKDKAGSESKRPAGEFNLYDVPFNHPPKFFAVVEGGWLPLPFIVPYNLLADRNVISRLKEINAGKIVNSESRWWLQMIRAADFFINPMPAAIEGFTKSFPSLAEFKDNYEAAVKDLQEFLVGSLSATKVIEYPAAVLPEVYRILADQHSRNPSTIEFLKQTAPLIIGSVSKASQQSVEDRIFEIADSVGLEKISFAMLTVLSCLYQSNPRFAAAKKIIKLKVAGYTDETLYNVLSDFRILGIYAANLGLKGLMGGDKDARFALVTGDEALAYFTCGLDINDVTLSEHGAKINFGITSMNFPDLDEAGRIRLSERLKT